MTKKIRKAVFPVAGLGTRFLPVTKASPKEMLPIVDKPLIQYAVEEAAAAGIEVMIFVTGRNKSAISNHFDTAYELETELERREKSELLDTVRSVTPPEVSCTFIRQSMPLGLGHAVLCAEPLVREEPFAVMLADDLIDNSEQGCMGQMVDQYAGVESTILGVEEIDPQESERYGIVYVRGDDRLAAIQTIVEKPKPEVAPSNLAVVGRYILTPRIFHHLSRIEAGSGGEIQLTDAIDGLLTEEKVMAYRFDGVRYDCGSKGGYLQATVDHALKHPDLGEEFFTWLQARVSAK